MNKPDSVYYKSNSILELRGASVKLGEIMGRIQSVCEKASQGSQEDVLLLACRGLMNKAGKPGFFLRDHVIEEIARLQDDELERYLRYRYAYDIFPIEKIVRDYPPLVQIEPSSICNYRCVFCYQSNQKFISNKDRHMGVMGMELFRKVVDQLEGNVEAVTLASRGEPLINKKLPDMLRYLSGKFFALKINTNASLLDNEVSHAILESGIQTLVFSADAASEPLYSQMRVNGKLENVARNIERFNNIRAKHYPSSRTITRVSGVRYTKEQDMNEIESFWKNLADQVMFVNYNPLENIYDAESSETDEPCSELWRRMFIWWDGRVNPCENDYLTTLSSGTVRESSISEIWRGEMYETLREKHLTGKRRSVKPCSNCVFV